jgi:hypothetical protein
LINPQIFSQYINTILYYSPSIWITPTIGAYLRLISNNSDFWLQFIPPLFGAIWLFQYWFFRRDDWSWKERLPLILIVSIITSAYSWTYDQIILLLPVFQIFAWISLEKHHSINILSAILYEIIAISFLYFLPHTQDYLFIWFAPSILIWYLITQWLLNKSKSDNKKVESFH